MKIFSTKQGRLQKAEQLALLILDHEIPLQKHTYSNILKISPLKTEIFQIKILIFFYISAQNICCEYSLE